MTNLTEQYLNGNLQDGEEYYVENKDSEVSTMHLYNDTIHWHSFKVKKLKVLAPVPSYEEWEKFRNRFSDYQIENSNLLIENTKLKELLKRVVKMTAIYEDTKAAANCDCFGYYKLIKQINQVLGEE